MRLQGIFWFSASNALFKLTFAISVNVFAVSISLRWSILTFLRLYSGKGNDLKIGREEKKKKNKR